MPTQHLSFGINLSVSLARFERCHVIGMYGQPRQLGSLEDFEINEKYWNLSEVAYRSLQRAKFG